MPTNTKRKHEKKVTEADVELAERYAVALTTIEEATPFTEADVELAERHAAALKVTEDATAMA